MHERRIARLANWQVDGFGTGKFAVRTGGIEMRVVRYDASFAAHYGEQDVFSGSSLMRGDDVTEPKNTLHSSPEPLKTRRSSVRFIAAHHCGPLLRGHRGRAGISQQVDQNRIRRDGE